jgi:hypothetical protein
MVIPALKVSSSKGTNCPFVTYAQYYGEYCYEYDNWEYDEATGTDYATSETTTYCYDTWRDLRDNENIEVHYDEYSRYFTITMSEAQYIEQFANGTTEVPPSKTY